MNAQFLVDIAISIVLIATFIFFILKFDRFAVNHGPEILTTLGIFGCFLGVVLALWELKPDDIITSMPALIGGIKTAFISSLMGVAGAIMLRTMQRFRKVKQPINRDEAKSNSIEDVVESLAALREGLVGSEQGTLLTQLKLLRQEQKDHSEEFIKEFKNFATHMVENNQKAIIEALEGVIKDFNQKLTEQFGENFKQLNSAVEKLVVWQIQYKDELGIIKDAQNSASVNMRSAVDALEVFVNKASSFTQITEDLREQIDFLEKNRGLLIEQQLGLSDLLSKLSEVTPEFSAKSTEMLESIRLGMNQVSQEASQVTKQLKETSEKNNEELKLSVQTNTNNLKESITQTQSVLNETIKNLGIQVQQSNSEMKNLLAQVVKENQEKTNESLRENVNIIKEGVLALDKALQKELNDALEGLSRQLASLSAKFVEDYTPLTERLREIVQISKKL